MVKRFILFAACLAASFSGAGAQPAPHHDLILRGGTIYDGSGAAPLRGDIAVSGQRIQAVGDLGPATADKIINVAGLAVAPGFINVLSWATESLLVDGHSQSDIRQGVTLEVFGEGRSMGPINQTMRSRMLASQGDLKFPVPWTTLGEYLDHLVARGVSPNVASFVGATTLRIHELGYANTQPTPQQLARMQALAATAMREGALGIGSSLIYAPGFYADTEELVALTQTVARFGGTYISHLRSEGNRLLESIDELIHIARASRTAGQIYHLKVSGEENWHKLPGVIKKINNAQAQGIEVSANMYTYTAGSTGLDAAMPPWVQEGGYAAWARRLQDAKIRRQLDKQMTTPSDQWENLLLAAGAEQTLLVGFRNPKLRKFTGQTLAAVARQKGKSVPETAMDLVVEDGSRVQVVYFLMSEANVRKTLQLPWVSFGSDAASMANTGVFLKRSTHPRAYGNFARVLGKYTRDEQAITLRQAVHKLSGLPATQLKLQNRGFLRPGYHADIAVFDPATVQDHATYDQPHQYATGMVHVLVNGTLVLHRGEHTGATPGQVVRGPGWQPGVADREPAENADS